MACIVHALNETKEKMKSARRTHGAQHVTKIETKGSKKEELPCSKVVYCSGVKGNEEKNRNHNTYTLIFDHQNNVPGMVFVILLLLFDIS